MGFIVWNTLIQHKAGDEQQRTELSSLRQEHLKNTKTAKVEIKILKAELELLEISDTPDMDEIHSKIEQIGVKKTLLLKQKSVHKQDIRKVLTNEQRVYFDSGKKGKSYCERGQRHHQGKGKGYGRQ